MRKQLVKNIRYIDNENEIKEKLLTGQSWNDYTFKFFSDGSAVIVNNNLNLDVPLGMLKGSALDAYVRARIDYIKVKIAKQAI